jgi:hypothetical protein
MQYKDFVKFVNEQRADTRIDHETWNTCAIGEWFDHEEVDMDELCYSVKRYLLEVVRMPNDLVSILDSGRVNYLSPYKGHDIYTYGGLQELIRCHFS